MPRRSRASRSLPPNPPDVRSTAMDTRDKRATTRANVGTPQHAVKPHPRAIDDVGERNRSARWRSARARIHLGRHEQADRRDAGRTGASHIVANRLGDAANRQHRHTGPRKLSCAARRDRGAVATPASKLSGRRCRRSDSLRRLPDPHRQRRALDRPIRKPSGASRRAAATGIESPRGGRRRRRRPAPRPADR